MHPDEIRSRLTQILVESLGIHQDQITNSTLLDDIASDSLEVTQAVMEVEAAFGIEITDTYPTGLLRPEISSTWSEH